MQKAMSTAGAAAQRVSNSADPMDIAQTSLDMSEAKVQMALGAFLINAQNDLMETSLQAFGIGTKHDGYY